MLRVGNSVWDQPIWVQYAKIGSNPVNLIRSERCRYGIELAQCAGWWSKRRLTHKQSKSLFGGVFGQLRAKDQDVMNDQNKADSMAQYIDVFHMVDRSGPAALELDTSSQPMGELLLTKNVRKQLERLNNNVYLVR